MGECVGKIWNDAKFVANPDSYLVFLSNANEKQVINYSFLCNFTATLKNESKFRWRNGQQINMHHFLNTVNFEVS